MYDISQNSVIFRHVALHSGIFRDIPSYSGSLGFHNAPNYDGSGKFFVCP